MNYRQFIICLVLTLTGCKNFTSPKISENGKLDIDHFLQTQISDERIPGIVAIVCNKTGIIYENASGFNSLARKDSMRTHKIFNIASMTKAITCASMMQLVEQGRIKVEDPVTQYLPEFSKLQVIENFREQDTSYTLRPPSREVTIHDLLTHTSGLGYEFSSSVLLMIDQKNYHGNGGSYLDYPLLFDPGSRWNYGTNMEVLGKIIEKISGKPLDQYFYQAFFKPLEMNDTFYDVPDNKIGELVSVYNRENGTWNEKQRNSKPKPAVGGGYGLYSTAEDYLKFLQMLLNNGEINGIRFLSEKSILEMTKNQIGDLFITTQHGVISEVSNDFPSRAGKDKFGYGFVITTAMDNDRSGEKPGSYGWAGIYNTYYWVDPTEGIAAVILMQVLPFYDHDCIETLEGFEKSVYKNLANAN